MGKDTKIEWALGKRRNTDFMNQQMACLAKGDAIGEIKSTLWAFGKMFNMMSVKAASPIIATMTTRKTIAREHIEAPALHFRRMSDPTALYAFAVNVSRRIRPARNTTSPLRLAHFYARFNGMLLSNSVSVAAMYGSDSGFRGISMMTPNEYRRPSLGTYPHIDPAARKAGSIFAIVARAIHSVASYWIPNLTARASPLSSGQSSHVGIERHPGFQRRDFQCTFLRLGHVAHFIGAS